MNGDPAEQERRHQLVEAIYDQSRRLGLETLKILLSTSIVLAGVPIVFYDKVKVAFQGLSLSLIMWSWVLILGAVLSGFLAVLFIFEGFYHRGHREEARWFGGKAEQVRQLNKTSNNFFDLGHYCGLSAAVLFTVCLILIIGAITLQIVCPGSCA